MGASRWSLGAGRSSRRWLAVVGALGLPCLFLATVSSAPASAAELASVQAAPQLTETTTDLQPGETPYPIPAGTTSLQVQVVGSGGEPGSSYETPGQGAYVTATITPPSGVSTLYLEVGTNGASPGVGTNGGGGYSDFGGHGGGESAIQTCSVTNASCEYTAVAGTDPRLVVAGGGGGAGEKSFVSGTGGSGGDAGATAATTGPGAGGNGTDSGNGAPGGSAGLADTSSAAPAGAGSPNCAAAPENGGNGGTGSPGLGGTGGTAFGGGDSSGGGGGGGWVGGSGGGAGDCSNGEASGGSGGGGGGGASYVESSATAVTVGEAGAMAPEVVVTATVGEPPAITSPAGTTFHIGYFSSFTLTATGKPTPVVSDGGALLPRGVSFTSNANGTATISGKPLGGAGGLYRLTITAANGIAPSATQTFTLEVSPVASDRRLDSLPGPGN